MDETVSVSAVGPAARPIILYLAEQGRLDRWARRLEELRTFILLQVGEFSAVVELARQCRPDLFVADQAGVQGIPADFTERFLESPIGRVPFVLLRSHPDPVGGPALAGAKVEAVLPVDLDADLTAIRLRAVLRRRRPTALIAHLRWGPLELRHDERTVLIGGQPVHLTPHEFNLLALFLEAPDHVWSREELQDALWGPGMQMTKQAINNVAQKLRRHLTPVLGHELIETVRGEGYRLAGSVSKPTIKTSRLG